MVKARSLYFLNEWFEPFLQSTLTPRFITERVTRLQLKPVLIVSMLVVYLAGCSVAEPEEVQSLYGYSMGTSYSIKVVGGLTEVRNLQLGIEGVLADINSRMSTYLPKSDLSKFAMAQVGEPVLVDPKTVDVVDASLKIAKLTNGAFDPTVAPLVDLWGFGPKPSSNVKPSVEDVNRLLVNVGYQAIQFDRTDQSLTKSAPRELDLSAIAKGYSVDKIAEYLSQKGFNNYLVEVGGEMRFSGNKPNQQPWRIAIEKPVAGERSPFRIIEPLNAAVATSGDYRNFFEQEGQRYSHTINPKTGWPIKHSMASVTVVTDSCMEADAYATAMLVMGVDQALELANSLALAAFFIVKENDEFATVQSDKFTETFGVFEN